MTAHDDAWIQGLAHDPATVRTIELDGRIVPAGNPPAAGVSHYAPGDHPPDPDVDPETGELPWDGFRGGRIQNFLGLAWVGRKVAEYERGIAQNEAVHASFLAEVEKILEAKRKQLMGNSVERLAEVQAPLREQAAFFRTAIESFARDNRKTLLIGGAKSREIPDAGGLRLAWRTQKAGYRWDQSKTPAENKAALLDWCRAEEDVTGEILVKGNPAPDLDAIKMHLAALVAAGENIGCPPGLEYIPAGETLTVSVGEEESK